MPQKQVTSRDVAELAGVSQPTVSRAFGPDAPVSPETRARVLAAASELGYMPNAIARSLKSRSTNMVGIVMSNLASSFFYNNVLEKFAQHLQAMGKQVLLFSAPPDRSVDEILPRVLGYQVDALIITSSTPGQAIIEECARIGTPVILFNRFAPETQANVVCCDNEDGGRQVADAFLDAGHQRIAYMAGPSSAASNQMRQKGFMDQLKARGYGGCRRENGAYTYESGCSVARSLLDRDDPPDAIFCAADVMALGALDVARYELGIRVPDELSIIGFDDITIASWPAYNLTTVRMPINRMIDAALHLVNHKDNEAPTGQIKLLPGELIVRGSARMA